MPTRRQCPNCGCEVSGYDKSRDERLIELGVCLDCQKDLSDEELSRRNRRCITCRERRAQRAANKRNRGLWTGGHIHRPKAGYQ
jgi:hypothetical protein